MPERTVWRAEIDLAVEGWRRPPTTLFAPAHALVQRLVRSVSPRTAQVLHDAGVRKPLAVSPLHIEPVASGLARGHLTLRVWDPTLADLLDEALARSLALTVGVQGRPAVVLDARSEPRIALARLLTADPVPVSVGVRFVSPTFFSLGRRFGRQQYGLLPLPELTVASWLRAWGGAGGEAFSATSGQGWLAERVVVRDVGSLTTVTVNGGKTALTGFQGDVRYAWVGPEPWGPRLLAALARFAEYCGTGAKTGYGFGVTIADEHLQAGRLP